MTTPFPGPVNDRSNPSPDPRSPSRAVRPAAGNLARASGQRQSDAPNRPGPSTGPELPGISLPTGGGAIKGIDEKLTTGQATGAALLTLGIPTSQARQGSGPQLQLTYESGSGNGPFGMGWRLPVAAITRKTSPALPRYQDATDPAAVDCDAFILSGAEDLVALLQQSASGWAPETFTVTTATVTYTVRRYRPRVEATFSRIERWTDTATGDAHWRTVSRNNVTSLFGLSAASRIADPEYPNKIFSWLLDLSYDDRGNAISYEYKGENATSAPDVVSEAGRDVTANRYLKRVFYGNEMPFLPEYGDDLPNLPDQWCFQVVLDYGEHNLEVPTPAEETSWPCRPDPFSTYRAGFEVRTYRTCQRVLMFHQFPELATTAVLVRSTNLSYSAYAADPAEPWQPACSFLTSVSQTGWVAASSGSGYTSASLPAVKLSYSPLVIDDTCRTASQESMENLPGSFGASQQWIDLNGEGLQGVLTDDERAWYYKRNLSAWSPDGGPRQARFAPLREVAEKPSRAAATAPLRLTDLDGDGHLAAVSFAPPIAGWYERGPADGVYRGTSSGEGSSRTEGWTPFRSFKSAANVDWSSADLRLVDLTGDGLADILITGDDGLTWYPWIPRAGFGAASTTRRVFDEDMGPVLVLADGTNSVYLADMSGDGLSDLVRIGNGEVCYWPNLGYGRFGAKITMDGAPVFDLPDIFDQRRIRLADIDGSGTADLVYASPDDVTIWFNQSGNSFAAGRVLAEFPEVDDVSAMSAFDLLGTGTACLVWTSPLPGDAMVPLRYVDITSGTKPYLLTGIDNGLGAQTTLQYAPSTMFYLQDMTSGTPWVTRLPFPVHVVDRVEVGEGVSRTSSVSTYSYHHGYYDGVEREFRGFARVDQLDADSMPRQSGTGTFTSTPETAGDDFTLPPVLTRTWYHTGAWLGSEDIASRLAAEYYQFDPEAVHLGDTVLPSGASSEELREACRALRGRVLRSEVYAEDGTASSVHPYATSEHRYQVTILQPTARQLRAASNDGPPVLDYAVFLAHELEFLTYSYERQPSDPRISHQLTLAVDDYGNVTREAAIGYQRRTPAYDQQSAPLITYAEHDIANIDDQASWYRLGLPVETRSYELTGFTPPASALLFDGAALLSSAANAAEIPYEQGPTSGILQKRLYGRARTYYRSNDLVGPLNPGQVESLAIVDASYTLMFTPGLLSQVLGPKISSAALTALLASSGGQVDIDGDGNQWAPSPKTFYSPNPTAPDPAFAGANFYLAQGATDQWGNISTVAYDSHNLVVTQTRDAADNTTSAQINYRMLQPWLVTDPNLNRIGVRFDPLGMLKASALMGKLLPDGSDEGDHLDLSTDEPSANDDPTSKYCYDLSAYETWANDASHNPDRPQPVWACVSTRVRHKDPATQWLQTYTYTDGLGRVTMAKAQAEPGPAPARDASGNLIIDSQGQLELQPTTTRWVGTGRVVYDNKGNAVKTYEPFFDSSSEYDDETELVEWGVTAITRYDPLARAIRIDNPNGSFRTIEVDSWHQITSDENDTVLSSAWYAARNLNQLGPDEADAAAKAATDSGTPSLAILDPLGRAFITIEDNGPAGQYSTVLDLDIQGNVRNVCDALRRQVLFGDFSVTGTQIHSFSVDAGERWVAADIAGQPLQTWDSRATQSIHDYDMLRRPTAQHVIQGASPSRVAQQITYGEGPSNAQTLNLRGAIYQLRDEAGIATTTQRDFKGNIVSANRQMLQDYTGNVDWALAPLLDTEIFPSASTYDALSRPVTVTTPDGSVTNPVFNERSLLAQVNVDLDGAPAATSFVSTVSYDPKGQRQQISYGNGATTSYIYDPDTFRLIQLQTTRPAGPNPLQDLTYTYDPVGNITRLKDAAQQASFFANQYISPSADYTYDAIYRLVRASGREQIGQAAAPQTSWDDSARAGLPLPADYTETYGHDAVGNITSVVHAAAVGNWTRTYAYDEPTTPPASNQLTSTMVGSSDERYAYDPNGNITAMPQLAVMDWDWKNQLQSTTPLAPSDAASQTTYYTYASSGERIRKITVSPTGSIASRRLYLGGYEVYREYATAGAVTLERQSLHVCDGARVICLVETTTIDAKGGQAAAPSTVIRYQFGNLLGSAIVELDPTAAIISYEEYYPYGSTSFQAGPSAAEVSLKRYRYTGRERDKETGLGYHGARYYAQWLGRWISCDPAGTVEGPNLYRYALNNPACLSDTGGRQVDSSAPTGAILPAYGSGRSQHSDDSFDALAQQRLAQAVPKLELPKSGPPPPSATGTQGAGSSSSTKPPDTTIYNAGPNQAAGIASNAPTGMRVTEINLAVGVSSPADRGAGVQALRQLTVHVRGLSSPNVEQGVMLTIGGSAPIVTTEATPEAASLAYTFHLGSRYDPDAEATQWAKGFWLTLTAPFGQRPLTFNPTATGIGAISRMTSSAEQDFNWGATSSAAGQVNNRDVYGFVTPFIGLNQQFAAGDAQVNVEGQVGSNLGLAGPLGRTKQDPAVPLSVRGALGIGVQGKGQSAWGAEIIGAAEPWSNIANPADGVPWSVMLVLTYSKLALPRW
jgi:RHS repeat-associated protein